MAKCDMCGKDALEVINICPDCLKRAAVEEAQIKRLKQISNVLSITAGTDGNIKECMESLLDIAKELERGAGHGKEKKKRTDTEIRADKDNYIQHGEAEQGGKKSRDKAKRAKRAGEVEKGI